MAKRDRVYDELLCFLSEPMFQIPVRSFMDENCLIFDPDAETSREHRDVFEKYKKLVDGLLEAFCVDAKITVDEAIQGIGRLNKIRDLHEIFNGMFEQVLAAVDFSIFSTAMAKRNIMIQEQVLAVILASTGALPLCLTRESPAAAVMDMQHKSPCYVIIGGMDDKEEQQLMQLVMQKSTSEKPPCSASGALSQKTVEISQREVELLAKDRQHLEQKMQHLAISGQLNEAASRSCAGVEQLDAEQVAGSGSKPSESDEKTASSTHSAFAASMSQLSADEIRQRQEFLRQQRDKLLAMKKAEREKQLRAVERDGASQRPVSARAARSALHASAGAAASPAADPDNDKKMAMRKAIAEKLRQEVIGK